MTIILCSCGVAFSISRDFRSQANIVMVKLSRIEEVDLAKQAEFMILEIIKGDVINDSIYVREGACKSLEFLKINREYILTLMKLDKDGSYYKIPCSYNIVEKRYGELYIYEISNSGRIILKHFMNYEEFEDIFKS